VDADEGARGACHALEVRVDGVAGQAGNERRDVGSGGQ
jgi:hypothetical protein